MFQKKKKNTIVIKKILVCAVQDMLKYLYMCDKSDERLDSGLLHYLISPD